MWRESPRGRQTTYRVEYAPLSTGWGEPLQVNRRPGGMLFSNYEKKQIAESVALLTIALALALTGGLNRALEHPMVLGVKLLMSFAAVMTGFLLHELAHKYRLNNDNNSPVREITIYAKHTTRAMLAVADPGSDSFARYRHRTKASPGPTTNSRSTGGAVVR
mgnify:CR=1 FL=1